MDLDILGIKNAIEPTRKKLLNHPIYQQLDRIEHLQVFMEHHVYAVWDFMLLLKRLQRDLTSTGEAWYPTPNRIARRLINDIVLGEESDIDINGQPSSHYEMYLGAMKQAGADTRAINYLMQKTREGHSLKSVVRYNLAELNKAQLKFIRFTQELLQKGGSHEVAAAFSFGREDLIPDLFTEIVRDLNERFGGRLSAFVYYLERHIELDADEHGPMAEKMIRELCGNDETKWEEAKRAAQEALTARLEYWDAIAQKLSLIQEQQKVSS